MTSKYGFCKPQTHLAAVCHLRQKNLKLRTETADEFVRGSELRFKCTAYILSLLLLLNIRDNLRRKVFQLPKSLSIRDFREFFAKT